MVTKLTKGTFIRVLIITATIFVTGIFVGFSIDTIRTDIISEEIKNANLEAESYMVAELFTKRSENFCEVAPELIYYVAKITEKLGSDLETFGEKRMFRKESYEYLLRRYYIYEIKFWLLVEDYKKECNRKIATILYFFGSDEPESIKQGYVLTVIRKRFRPDVLVFSFNTDFEKEQAVNLLKSVYNITITPTIVINDVKHERFMSTEEIENIIKRYLGE